MVERFNPEQDITPEEVRTLVDAQINKLNEIDISKEKKGGKRWLRNTVIVLTALALGFSSEKIADTVKQAAQKFKEDDKKQEQVDLELSQSDDFELAESANVEVENATEDADLVNKPIESIDNLADYFNQIETNLNEKLGTELSDAREVEALIKAYDEFVGGVEFIRENGSESLDIEVLRMARGLAGYIHINMHFSEALPEWNNGNWDYDSLNDEEKKVAQRMVRKAEHLLGIIESLNQEIELREGDLQIADHDHLDMLDSLNNQVIKYDEGFEQMSKAEKVEDINRMLHDFFSELKKMTFEARTEGDSTSLEAMDQLSSEELFWVARVSFGLHSQLSRLPKIDDNYPEMQQRLQDTLLALKEANLTALETLNERKNSIKQN